jgi:hypothetical protein
MKTIRCPGGPTNNGGVYFLSGLQSNWRLFKNEFDLGRVHGGPD